LLDFQDLKMNILSFIFVKAPFYVLYVLSYGFTIVTLYSYGIQMPDHVYFMLFWVSFMILLFSFVFYLFYEADQENFAAELKRIFICERRGIFTPFFFIGLFNAANYILVAIANPHVKSIYQVLASILQLPFVIIFNRIVNGEKLMYNRNYPKQIITLLAIFIFYAAGLCLVSYNEFTSHFENFGSYAIYSQLFLFH